MQETIGDITELVKTGQICPYCLNKPELVDSKVVYGSHTHFGMIYLCKPCDAYVGVHKGTEVALGRLANGTLRQYKKQAHASFDPIWQSKVTPHVTKNVARTEMYLWLAEQMDLEPKDCHIGMFDERQCVLVMQICATYKFEGDET